MSISACSHRANFGIGASKDRQVILDFEQSVPEARVLPAAIYMQPIFPND